MARNFEIGDRVILKGNWEFPDGTIGTIAPPLAFQIDSAQHGEWEGHRHIVQSRKGPITFYYVTFDQAADDGSGDGPYEAAEIDEESLLPHA